MHFGRVVRDVVTGCGRSVVATPGSEEQKGMKQGE